MHSMHRVATWHCVLGYFEPGGVIFVHSVLPPANLDFRATRRAQNSLEVFAAIEELDSIEEIHSHFVRRRSNLVEVISGVLDMFRVGHEVGIFRNQDDRMVGHRFLRLVEMPNAMGVRTDKVRIQNMRIRFLINVQSEHDQ